MDIYQLYETRKLFTKPAGELIEQFFPFDKEKALNFQAGLVALKTAKPDVNAYAIRDEAALNAKLAETSVDADAIAGARKIVDAKDKSGALKDVPPLGDIAVKLGLVDVKIKDMLMEAQAAIRTLDSMDNLEHWNKSAIKPVIVEVFDRRVHETIDRGSKDIARSFIGKNSPKSVIQSQALNHLADIYASVSEKVMWYRSVPKHVLESVGAFKAAATITIGVLSKSFEELGSKDVHDKLWDMYVATSNQLWLVRGVDAERKSFQDHLQTLSNSIWGVFGDFDKAVRDNKTEHPMLMQPKDTLVIKDLVNLRLNQARGVQLSGAEQAMFEGR